MGYCATKGIYYYGLKLHALGFCRAGRLPHPERIIYTPASVSDLALYKEAWSEIEARTFFGDKIYNDRDFFGNMAEKFRSEMLTPVKAVKGMPEVLKKFDRAADDLYSKAVSKIRQPIEALFNWLIERADIQKAQGQIHKRTDSTRIWQTRGGLYNTNILTLDSHYYFNNF